MASAPAQIPTSFGHELRACLRCRLVKTYDQVELDIVRLKRFSPFFLVMVLISLFSAKLSTISFYLL